MRTGNLADPVLRLRLARDIKRTRKHERELAIGENARFAYKRNRPFSRYQFFLVGLGATLEYVKTLPSPSVVDLGAGTGRALVELEQSKLGKGLTLTGTGLLWDRSLVFKDYRITPAELMRGFKPASVGAFLSVFGPIHYTDHLPLVMERLDELLIPGGVVKFAMTVRSSTTPTRDIYHQYVLKTVGRILYSKGYGLSKREKTISEEGAEYTYRALLAVKGDSQSVLASSLAEKDEATFPDGPTTLDVY